MFISDASANEALDKASRQILPDRPLDFQLGYQAAFADTRYRLLSDSATRAHRDAYDAYIDDIYKETGKRLDNPYAVKIRRNRDFAWDVEPAPDERLDARLAAFGSELDKLAAAHPDLKIISAADLDAGIAARAKDLKAAADGGVNVGWAGLGAFAGSAVATMTDPVNALAMMIGVGPAGATARATTAARTTLSARLAGAGSEIGATAVREAGINAATTAAVQPMVISFNQSLGIDHGLAEAAHEVAGAAVGGAVLGGGIKGLGMGLGHLLESWKGAKAAGKVAEDLDSRDAEKVLQAAKDRQDASPYPPTPQGDMASDAALAESFRALLRGEPVDPTILGQFHSHRTQAITDLAARADGAKATTGTSDMVAYGVILPDQAARIGPEVKAMLGRDTPFLDTAVRRLDGEGIRHAINEHAADKVPFRAADAAHIPDVVERGELVSITRDHLTNRPFLLWRKLVNGNWLHVGEEVVGERTPGLRAKTAYWTEGPKTRGGEPGSPPPDARFTGSMPEGQQANVRNVGGGPVSDSIAPPAKKSKAAPQPWPEELRPPAEGRPETLVDFLRRQGGVADTDGWLKQLGVANRVRPGLVAANGLHLDEAALRAHEAGFFPDFGQRPDMDVLRHAIADELDGIHTTIRPTDQDLAARWRDWETLHAELDKAGVDPAGKSFDLVKAEMAAHRAAERASEEGLARSVSDFLSEIRPELEYERAVVSEMRGRLMGGDDIAVPTGLTDAEGRSVTASARDAMDGFDAEFEAWDAAFGCLSK